MQPAKRNPPIARTQRLLVRQLMPADAPFILRLLNEPSFLRHIGDRGVRTLDDAREYILSGPVASYAAHGTGLSIVCLRDGGIPVGMCGLLHRENLDYPDLGYAFLPEHRAKGYAFEAARAIIDHGVETLGLARIVAVTGPDNQASIALLHKLGFVFDRVIQFVGENADSNLYYLDRGKPEAAGEEIRE